MPIETEPERLRIETGRTWRDLPSEPPTTAPDRPRVSPSPSPDSARRTWPWTRIGIGALALTIGIAVGAWAPWSEAGADTTPDPLAADELPETIVPDTPEELIPEPDSPDDPFFSDPDRFEIPEEFFDQLPEDFLEQFPDGFFEGTPGVTPDDAGLIELEGLPNGYQERSNVYSQSGDRASQRIRLLGPDGPVDVQAIAGPDVTLPDSGEPVLVGGSEGRLIESDDSITISYLAGPDLLITVESAATTGRETLAAIAEAVEVKP